MKMVFLLISALLIFFACASYADQVHLAWDASTSVNVNGYRIWWGGENAFSDSQDVGNVLDAILEIPKNKYIAATAYGLCDDGNGGSVECESGFSNVVFYYGATGILSATNIMVNQACSTNDFIKKEDNDFLLKEDNDRIIIK